MNTKECRGEVMPSIKFTNTDDLTAENIAMHLEQEFQMRNIPAKIQTDRIQSGRRLLGSWHPCVKISHPNPPQAYFDQLIIINGNILNFQFWGYSKANYKKNKKQELSNSGTLSGMIRGALVSDDDMAFQTEMAWHEDIAEAIKSCIY